MFVIWIKKKGIYCFLIFQYLCYTKIIVDSLSAVCILHVFLRWMMEEMSLESCKCVEGIG